jgi:hypothetical protein
MSEPQRGKYRTTNWSEYNEALKRRGSLMAWLDADLQWQAHFQWADRLACVFSDAAIQFCLTLKCMFGLGLRQATDLAESLIKLARVDWSASDYSTLSRRQKTLSVAAAIIPTRRSAKPWTDARAGVQARNEILRAMRKLGRSIWKKWSGHHRRSLVETKMGCHKLTIALSSGKSSKRLVHLILRFDPANLITS